MLPDCECKGRAFLHSLQDFTEKKCEKISFAPILPSHSIAKSALKPIFSPLPHPTFFAPKSPFFALFPISNPIPGDFSRKRARFLPCEVHLFLLFPVSNPISSDFSRDRSSLFPSHSPFRIARPPFLFRLHLHLFPTPPSSPDLLPFRPSSPLTFAPPPLSLTFLPTFPSSSPINARSRAPSRTTHVRVRSRTRPPIRRFSFIAFTASPAPRNPLCNNALGVKENKKKPSQNTQSSQNQYLTINTRFHPL